MLVFLCITKKAPRSSRSSKTKLFDHILYSPKNSYKKKKIIKCPSDIASQSFSTVWSDKQKGAGRTWQEIKRGREQWRWRFWRWGKEIRTQRMLGALWSAAKLRGSRWGWNPHSVRARFVAITANTCGSRGRWWWWVGEGCYGVSVGEQSKNWKWIFERADLNLPPPPPAQPETLIISYWLLILARCSLLSSFNKTVWKWRQMLLRCSWEFLFGDDWVVLILAAHHMRNPPPPLSRGGVAH